METYAYCLIITCNIFIFLSDDPDQNIMSLSRHEET